MNQQLGNHLAMRTFSLVICFAIILSLQSNVRAQDGPVPAPPPSHEVPVKFGSGMVENNSDQPAVIWSQVISSTDAKWIQLRFKNVRLTQGKKLASKLRITSHEDGAFQILDTISCAQWQNKSAFFNGDTVTIELLAHPQARRNRVEVDMITAGDVPDLAPTESICDGTDDRVVSNDVRIGRVNVGCTAWLFDNRTNCMMTAGHCVGPDFSTIFFNVPLSDPDGSLNFPPPEDQYAVDPASIQSELTVIGNDWCVFGCFNNTNTGLSPLVAQGGASFDIAVPSANTFDDNDPIRITGFGTTSLPVNPVLNQAQKTDVGPFTEFSGTTLRYRPDTTGGNSGSPVVDENSGIAYGIHTNGGCGDGFGSNSGTGLNNAALFNAINNPQGICDTPAGPVNDSCQNPLVIGNGSHDFDTSDATTDGPSLPQSCEEGFGLSLVNDIWFSYTASCTGEATLALCTSLYDTRIAVYTGDGGCPGGLIDCNDDACNNLSSELTFSVVAGEDYIIRVGGFSGGGIGTMTVTCTGAACPVDISVVNNELRINGTQGPDEIIVSQNGSMLEVEANQACFETFALAGIDCVVINTFGGGDTIMVNAAVDTSINGGFGPDDIFGGTMTNEIFGGPGPDLIVGGPLADTLNAGRGQDTVFGLGGNDTILGGDASDTLYGGSGNDNLFGGLGADELIGSGGNDMLVGNVGADILDGGAGADELIGLGGPDEMIGGPGNDEFLGGEGFDTFNGGSGTDTALDNGEVEISIENT